MPSPTTLFLTIKDLFMGIVCTEEHVSGLWVLRVPLCVGQSSCLWSIKTTIMWVCTCVCVYVCKVHVVWSCTYRFPLSSFKVEHGTVGREIFTISVNFLIGCSSY